MKMHPKPMIKHTWPVIECSAFVEEPEEHPYPVHIVMTIDGRTQRIVMSVDEAVSLGKKLIGKEGAPEALPEAAPVAIYQIEQHNGSWLDLSVDVYESTEEDRRRIVYKAVPASKPIPSDCDVRKILLGVVPGNGDGLEVYAKNIGEVEDALSKMGDRIESFEGSKPIARDVPADQKPVCWLDPVNGLTWLVDRMTVKEGAKFYAAPQVMRSTSLDKFFFVPPTSEAQAGWNAAIVHVTAHLQTAATANGAKPIARDVLTNFDAPLTYPSGQLKVCSSIEDGKTVFVVVRTIPLESILITDLGKSFASWSLAEAARLELVGAPPSGTFACPICGKESPHEHSSAEVAQHRIDQRAILEAAREGKS